MMRGSAKFIPPCSLRMALLAGVSGLVVAVVGWTTTGVRAQTGSGTITLRADIQEANALTGVITARGNVQVEYPERQIYATSAQAQYFSTERRMILSGNVIVLQEGNRLEAETVTYLVDEGRFVALPQPSQQVRSTYILPAQEPATLDDEGESSASSGGENGSEAFAPLIPSAELEISPIESIEPTDTEPTDTEQEPSAP